MALNLPETASEVVQRAKVDVKRELPDSNPFLKNSFIGSIITAFANRIFDFYFALRKAFDESFADTAILNLERLAAIWNVTRNPATVSSGNFVITGTAGGLISKTPSTLTTWVSSDGKIYEATVDATIVLQSLSVTSITRTGSIATLTTVGDHLIASNVLITVTGADQSEYNVTGAVCTVTGSNTLIFTVSGTPATPATGTILLGFTSVSVAVTSSDFGADQDQVFDAVLTLQSPITNVDDAASVDFGALGGGADQEINKDLRSRYLDVLQNPAAPFNVAQITQIIKTISGVTRVFVQEITPDVGQVTVYFMRDNDVDPIPSSSEVATVKAALDEFRHAHVDTADLIVSAPTAVSTNYVFSTLSPNTAIMRTAIENSLVQFYAERPQVGQDIVEEAYNSAIFNTIDSSGNPLITFSLTSPSADISIASGEIGQLGNITF